MSLRSKIVLILLAVVLGYTAFDNGLQRFVSTRQYDALQLDRGEELAGEVAGRIDRRIDALEEKARIWSSLPAVRAITAGGGDAAIERSLGADALAASDADLFYLCDAQGNVLWHRVIDPSSGEPIEVGRELPQESLSATHPLLTFRQEQTAVSGLMMTERWPLLVSSVPIAADSGPALEQNGPFGHPTQGVVVLGTFLDPALRAEIAQAEDVKVELFAPDEAALDPDERDLLDGLTLGEAQSASRVGPDDLLHLFRSFQDLRTGYPLVLRVAMERKIAQQGERAMLLALVSTIATAFLILFVLLRLLQKIVIKPLSTLTTKALEIGRTDDTTIRTGLVRDDEIGQLSTEFDSMLEKLAKSRAQVVSTARQAGMSEIATGVLHNVGNVLNSVNVSASLATKEAERFPTGDLQKLTSVLKQHEHDLAHFVSEDPRGQHLLPFLSEIVDDLGAQRRRLLDELGSLGEGIEHIADLVRSQQTYAVTKGVFEKASLAEEVEAAVRIATQVLDWPQDVVIERDFEELPSVSVDKHKLMEILVNLIQNAGHSIQEAGGERLVLRVRAAENGRVAIQVIDDGVGIPEENLARIFGHGFTTKGGGHGFGLHISANAATEMGASLRATSDGPGKGATFSLDIPINTEELASAA